MAATSEKDTTTTGEHPRGRARGVFDCDKNIWTRTEPDRCCPTQTRAATRQLRHRDRVRVLLRRNRPNTPRQARPPPANTLRNMGLAHRLQRTQPGRKRQLHAQRKRRHRQTIMPTLRPSRPHHRRASTRSRSQHAASSPTRPHQNTQTHPTRHRGNRRPVAATSGTQPEPAQQGTTPGCLTPPRRGNPEGSDPPRPEHHPPPPRAGKTIPPHRETS